MIRLDITQPVVNFFLNLVSYLCFFILSFSTVLAFPLEKNNQIIAAIRAIAGTTKRRATIKKSTLELVESDELSRTVVAVLNPTASPVSCLSIKPPIIPDNIPTPRSDNNGAYILKRLGEAFSGATKFFARWV